MEKRDYSLWPRREIYELFSGKVNPWYGVSFELDVTGLHDYTKSRSLSFYYALIYLTTEAVNRVDAFLYAKKDGELVHYDRRIPSFTDIKKGSELFYIVTMEPDGSLDEFCREARRISSEQTIFLDYSREDDGLIDYSCLPWIPMTGFSGDRPTDFEDSVPRITWGRYTERDGRLVLNMTIEANHRFADGFHIGRVYEELTGLLDQFT